MKRLTFVGLLVLLTAGCSGAKVYPVKGQLKLKDGRDPSALAGHVVDFESKEKMTSGSGEVKPDGTFEITTFEPGDGAVPGMNRIAINPPQPEADKVPPPPVIDRKYNSFDTSGLEWEIKPGTNEVNFELDPAPRR